MPSVPPKLPKNFSQRKTEKVDSTLLQIFEGENADELINNFSDEERKFFEELVSKIRSGELGKIPEMEELWKVDYVRRPPTIHEYWNEDYWMGQKLRPTDDNIGLFPIWQQILDNDFDFDSRIHNVVISGSLGIGKTMVGVTIFLYRVILATLLRNPQNFFGLNKGSSIVYAILSITKKVVTETAFGDALGMMGLSPYFLEELNFNPDAKYASQAIDLGRGISLTAGSKGQHIIGRNSMGVMLDEGNWRLEANPDERAYKLYDEIRTRISNRFQRESGFLPAISILASSAKDESSFTEKVINDIEKVNDLKTQRVYRHSIYKVKSGEGRHAIRWKERWFRVAYGLRNMDPVLLGGWFNKEGQPFPGDPDPIEQPPPGAKIELIPEDFFPQFQRNVKTNLQSLSGISTGGSHRFFSSMEPIERCLELSERDGPFENPAKIELIPISTEDDKNIWDYLKHSVFLTRRSSRIEPIRHPEAIRFAHVDLATTTLAGVAVCHLVGKKYVEGLVDPLGRVFSEYRLIAEYDFILSITAGRTKPISLEKIQNFFFWLRDICNYKFGLITADTYQSSLTLQMLESRGFKTDILSLDRKKDQYYSWRTAFEEGRLRLYKQYQLWREIENLVETDDKIDHPPDFEKDVCFTGDTKILSLDGKSYQLKDLQKGSKIWVYSLGSNGIVPAEATSLGKVSTESLVKITLDNGKIVKSTKDHLFMLRDGSYKRADRLSLGESLMPFYSKLIRGRRFVRCPIKHRQLRVYKLIHGHFHGPTPKGFVVHHINNKKEDDRPENLTLMEKFAHIRHHGGLAILEYNARAETKLSKIEQMRLIHKLRKEGKIIIDYTNATKELIQTNKKRGKQQGLIVKEKWRSGHFSTEKNCAGFIKKSKESAERIKKKFDTYYEKILICHENGLNRKDTAKKLKIPLSELYCIVVYARRHGYSMPKSPTTRSTEFFEKRKEKIDKMHSLLKNGISIHAISTELKVPISRIEGWKYRFKNNHSIVSIETIEEKEDVYCLNVPDVKNFALEAGIFVHNCDACAGAYTDAITSTEMINASTGNSPPSVYGQHAVEEVTNHNEAPITIPIPSSNRPTPVFFA
jgi:hypothetical protein